MRGLRRAGVLVAAATAGVAMLAGAANAAPIQPANPTKLPRGADIKVLYADGTSIHPPSAAPVAMPSTPGAFADFRTLLGGRASTGWIVWEHTSDQDPEHVTDGKLTDQIIRVLPDGSQHLIYKHAVPEPSEGSESQGSYWYGLSQDRKRFVQYLDFSGPRLSYALGSATYVWKPGHKPQVALKRHAPFVDFKHNLIFAKTSNTTYGPTSLSKPGRLHWNAPFIPAQVSPNGKRVVGLGTGCLVSRPCGGNVMIQIRRLSDGHVLAQFRSEDPGAQLTWESNDAVVYPVHDYQRGPNNTVVVRSRLSGVSNRATAWFDDHLSFSFPHAPQNAW